MTATINASTTAGVVTTADTSGILQLQTNGTAALTISASQVATFAQAPSLPAGSIPQAALAAGVAGNGPAFSAYQSSAQTLTGNVTTKIQLQSEEWDTASCFDSTTNYRFTPTVAGYYQASGGVQVATVATIITMFLFKNGSPYKQLMSTNSAVVSGGYGSAMVYLNGSTDYIELYVNLTTGQALNAQSYYCYFQAAMVRAA